MAALFVPLAAAAAGTKPALPYRFLLVISDQWKDPASQVIDDGGEFQTLAALLKSWCLPFDILRLDQQRLDRYHLLDRDGRPRYGTIVWDAGPEGLEGRGVELLPELAREHGVSVVVLGDTLAAPGLAGLAGVRYVSDYISRDNLSAGAAHFVTRALNGGEKSFNPGGNYWTGHKVAADASTPVLMRGTHPFLTVRDLPGAGRIAWLGAERAGGQLRIQVVRDLLKRCLVWAQGYALYQDYGKSVLLFMDDMGTSDKTYLPYWSYRTPTEEEIRAGLIEPLKRHKAVIMQDVATGYVDRATRRILNPWTQAGVKDELVPGRTHDFASTKRGLDAGLREGVFEIQSHGWTHMLPDLDSPPGPFWDAPMDGVGSLNWYWEFNDPIRKKEIPAATQLFHMRRSIELIRGDFGVTPLFLMRGGGGFSRSWPNHSARLAASLGFGLSELIGTEYLGRDYVINLQGVLGRSGWDYTRKLTAADIAWSPDAPHYIVFHDRDLALDGGSIARLLAGLGDGVRYMGANEFCAYLHAAAGGDATSLSVEYDDHYCRYFATAGSAWTLHLSDETRRALGASVPETRRISLPKGLGRHAVTLAP